MQAAIRLRLASCEGVSDRRKIRPGTHCATSIATKADCNPTQTMTRIPAWFERRFDFSFPAEQYPCICVRLRGAPARLEEMLQGVSRDLLLGKQEGTWSAQEHAGHLLDLESLWTARVDDFIADRDMLTVADLTNRKTHDANHNARESKDILDQFRTARFRLLDHVRNFKPVLFARSILHPRLKQPMRLLDHLCFVAEHDDHHLACIWEMLNS
jgi:uncharacterized damage-inducible protein DinB